MCIGGPKPAGSVASSSEKAPTVSSSLAFTVIVNSPRSIRRPLPGARTNAVSFDSDMRHLLSGLASAQGSDLPERVLLHDLAAAKCPEVAAADLDPLAVGRRAGQRPFRCTPVTVDEV